MSDRRTTPDPNLVDGQRPAQVIAPVVDLNARPSGPRDRQLIFGDPVTVLTAIDGVAYVVSEKDGYVGFVDQNALGPPQETTHWVSALATHVYAAADMKSPDQGTLSFGSRLAAISETPKFLETAHGFVPKQHVSAIDQRPGSPMEVAKLFLGTPYLWGGNSRLGLDCSGLIQAALLTCGYACPGDSDQQEAQLGTPLAADDPLKPGDLIFWKGHVAMVLGSDQLIHANAGHMAVALEGIEQAISRIERQGDGPVTARKRIL